MRRIPLGLVALAAIACAWSTPARELQAGKLRQYETPNYTLVTSKDDEASSLTTRLSQVESLLATVVPSVGPSNGLPVTIVVTPPHRWRKYFEDHEVDAGLLAHRFSYSVLLGGWRNGNALRKVAYYEYARLYMRAHYRGQLPLWYEVGLANLAYGASLEPDGATIGLDPFDSAREFGGATWAFRTDLYRRQRTSRLSTAELLRLDASSPAYANSGIAEQADFQSWMLVHRAYVTNLGLGRQIDDYLGRVALFETPEEAARQAFNKKLDEFDAEMADYERNSKAHLRQVHFKPAAPPLLSRLPDLEDRQSIVMVARALIDAGQKPARISEIIADGAKAGADLAGLLGLKMRVAINEKDDAAFGALIKEAERRIRQPRVARELALGLYERVHEDVPGAGADFPERQAMRERALQLLAPQVVGQPDDVEAVWSHAMLAAVLKRDLEVAQAAITRTRAHLPRNPDVALAAALLKNARGQWGTAVEELTDVVRYSPNSELRLWAAHQLLVVRTAR